MTPFHTEPRFTLHVGNSLDVLPTLPPSSVDSIVSDPPYGLSFMGKDWDHGVPGEAFWREALRVAKPGAHLLAFGGTRTFHRLAVAIEDAGWEIRDCVMWVYGSGFPKSHDVAKAIDKAAGAMGHEGHNMRTDNGIGTASYRATVDPREYVRPLPVTDAAKAWAGWGTALKPAWEPIIVARKPLDGTVAANVLQHGTGAINVDGCRIESDDGFEKAWDRPISTNIGARNGAFISTGAQHLIDISANKPTGGRWPANFIHDGSEEPTSILGDAARFFYSAKADKMDRDDGCKGIPKRRCATLAGADTDRQDLDPVSERFRTSPSSNNHPTVKPTDLMRYLVRMVTPIGGVVLDPFMGSGSTGRGALLEGCRFVGIDLSDEYATIARERIAACAAEPSLFDAVS
jgi:DNA modification methylase